MGDSSFIPFCGSCENDSTDLLSVSVLPLKVVGSADIIQITFMVCKTHRKSFKRLHIFVENHAFLQKINTPKLGSQKEKYFVEVWTCGGGGGGEVGVLL